MNNHAKNETFFVNFQTLSGFLSFSNIELHIADDEGLDVCHGKEGRWHRN